MILFNRKFGQGRLDAYVTALRLALLYAFFGGLWVLWSDRALLLFSLTPEAMTTVQTYKGWFYVGITACLIYYMFAKELQRRHKIEAELLESRDQLEQRVKERTVELADTIEEIESFSYSVSHDLRAPLRAISGFSEIIMMDHSDTLNDESAAYLKKIHKASNSMDELITDMLFLSDLSRKELVFLTFNLGEIVAQVFENMEATIGDRKIDFRIHPCPQMVADPKLMKVLLINLISNAVKFTLGEQNAVIEFGSLEEEDRTVYYLRDNGVGFNMEYAEKIFFPFQRLHRQDEFEGTGVGLAIASRVIKNHKGDIWVESEIGVGTTFYFTIDSR